MPRPFVTLSLLGFVCLAWGSTWLVIKFGLRDMPPLTSAGLRFALASAGMAVVAVGLARAEGGSSPPRHVVLAHGLGQFAANYAIVYFATTELPSGLVSVLWSVFPLLMALSGHFVTKAEPLSGRQWAGFALGFAGIVVLFATDIRAISFRAVIAGLVLLLAPLSVTVSTTWVKRHAAGVNSLYLNRNAMAVAAVVLLGLGGGIERDQPMALTPVAVASILYLALVGTVFTFGVYMWLLRFVPASRLSLTAYITPVIALFLGAVWGGEPVGPGTIAGTLLVLVGVAFATFSDRGAAGPPRGGASTARAA